MDIVFMGTPDFAIPSLRRIFKSKHKLLAVVTAPDKERGRGQKVSSTAVKKFAIKNRIPVLQPEKLKDENFISELKILNADLLVIVAFRILPPEVFNLPSKGAFNLHASLLPKYRGAAPIQWALINGENETGVTTFALEEKVDTGNIYLQEKIAIDDNDDFGILHDKLSTLGAEIVIKTIDKIETGNFSLFSQDNRLATPAPKITKDITEINWNKPAEEINNLIRGLSPYPGAYFTFNNRIIKIYKTKVVEKNNLNPGAFEQTKTKLFAGCGSKAIEILEIQQEGKKRLDIKEFLKGFNFT